MGLLLAVVKKSRGFIALGLVVLFLVFTVNFDPLISHIPYSQEIRNVLNPCIPIISAILIGISIRGIGLIYRLFGNAIEKHLKDLNKVAQAFTDKLNKEPAYFTNRVSSGIVETYVLYMHIRAPLCEHYNEIKSLYGDLVDDIGNHWRRAGEVLNKIDNLCKNVAQHNRDVNGLKQILSENIQKMIKDEVAPRLPGLIPDYFRTFVLFVLLEVVVRRIVDENRLFAQLERDDVASIYNATGLRVELESSGILRAGAYSVGKITPSDWKEYGERFVIDIIYEVLKKYGAQLDEYVKKGNDLIEQAKNIAEELKKELNNVAKARFLPVAKICKYLG
ncbi:hypothetical protein DRO69_00210 [Candidatus Bathyarchaeota archaeon]|nr:MAG: hypothetical protein DRO69_00210 [Candidatus Bathyarchaeota archaeon]